jgi:predicted MPP superfamily phosphohydrolase
VFSILHISDLHRSIDEPLDNNSLIAALLADRDRYLGESPVVPPPNAIVVSGDLIQGAPIGCSEWQNSMRDQYRVAGEFLDHLTRRFLDGDRSKMVIVPGNHDVCWNTSFSSMDRVPDEEYPDDVRAALIAPESNYRWSWKELALYRINNAAVYSQRMDAYWDFVEDFYAGVTLPTPIERSRGFQLFELHNRRIVVAAFDSVANNDCFSYAGALPRGAVARCNLDLRDIQHSYEIRIAVWHHSLQGPPLRDDYMDVGQVHEMVGLRFHLGMHGHQHAASANTHYVHLGESQAMAVVSAGSLCAGYKELPRGVNRQYNLIVIEDDMRRARVHAREMAEGGQFTRKNSGAFTQGFVELNWEPTTDAMGRAIDAVEQNRRHAVLKADEALHSGHPDVAIELLQGVELLPASHARRVATQAALMLSDWAMLIMILNNPCSTEEAILLISALIRTNNLDRAATILDAYRDIDAATRREVEEQIATKRMMRGK